MAAVYINTCNLEAARFAKPLTSVLPASDRGIVNEASFRIFQVAAEASVSPAALASDVVDDCTRKAYESVRAIRRSEKDEVEYPTEEGVLEAVELAKRTMVFWSEANVRGARFFPAFQGCGWLDRCYGD